MILPWIVAAAKRQKDKERRDITIGKADEETRRDPPKGAEVNGEPEPNNDP